MCVCVYVNERVCLSLYWEDIWWNKNLINPEKKLSSYQQRLQTFRHGDEQIKIGYKRVETNLTIPNQTKANTI